MLRLQYVQKCLNNEDYDENSQENLLKELESKQSKLDISKKKKVLLMKDKKSKIEDLLKKKPKIEDYLKEKTIRPVNITELNEL